MNKRLGYILIAVAVLHQLVGIAAYSTVLLDIGRAGIINTINPPYWERDAVFWFFMFGFMLMLYGGMTQWLLKHTDVLPSFWGWGLLALCLVGITMMPMSGFWLVIPIALLMIRMSRTGETRLKLQEN